jgi:membrane protein YqaA with SNARE-associated domain
MAEPPDAPRSLLARALPWLAVALVLVAVTAVFVWVRRAPPREAGWWLLLTTVAVAAAGSVLPLSPIEPYLVALPMVAPPRWLVPLAALAAVSHMAGKSVIFFAGGQATRAIPPRHRDYVERTRARLAGARWPRVATVLVSAIVGLPPLYLVTILAGALRVPALEFFLVATLGRAVRFGALVTVPGLFAG